MSERVLILCEKDHGVESNLLEVLRAVSDRVTVQIVPADQWGASAGEARAILLQPGFATKVAIVREQIATLRSRRPGSHIGLLDAADSTASPWMQLAGEVDSYLKKQLLRDRSLYTRDLGGGYVFADWGQRERGWALHGWHFGSVVPERDVGKIELGWSLGAADMHRKAFAWSRWRKRFGLLKPFATRTNDVICVTQVMPAGTGVFYSAHRIELARIVSGLSSRRVISGTYAQGDTPMLSKPQYLAAMRNSKICVSPFGWGEICHRDFEAIIHGCVLVKPDMSHLESEPDIYRANETYVPCSWDGSDLATICEALLKDPVGSQRMIDRARENFARVIANDRVGKRARAFLTRVVS